MPFYVFGLFSDGRPCNVESIRILYEPGDDEESIQGKLTQAATVAAGNCYGIDPEEVSVIIHGI